MEYVIVRRFLMGTRFEILLCGKEPSYLQGAAEEAFQEIENVERMLSIYIPESELSKVNHTASVKEVKISKPVCEFLLLCRKMWEITEGAFDITVGPLVKLWGGFNAQISRPSPSAIADALKSVGMQWVEIDPVSRIVRFTRPGIMLDPGGIGKGFALDKAREILNELGVTAGFMHSGTSTILAWGKPPEPWSWKVSLPTPLMAMQKQLGTFEQKDNLKANSIPLAIVELEDIAMSVSTIFNKAIKEGKRLYGHIIDPRSGQPVDHALVSAVCTHSAAQADALSTALIVLDIAGAQRLYRQLPGIKMVVVYKKNDGWIANSWGIALQSLEGRLNLQE